MNVYPLSEGQYIIGKDKIFIPFNDTITRRADQLLVEVQPFLIITSQDIIVLDTGLGFTSQQGKSLQLFDNLAFHGINRQDVTKVLISHLHKDHAGALTYNNEAAFPLATYYIQEKELHNALLAPGSSYNKEILLNIKHIDNLVLLREDSGDIDGYIHYEITAAHSPYHQVYWIQEGGDTLFFGGDDAPQLQQMKHRFVAKYDYDGKKSMELRSYWWEQAKKSGWTFLFYHDISHPITTP